MEGELLIIDDVPVDVCQTCNESYIAADTLKKIEGIKNHKGRSQRISLTSGNLEFDDLVHQLSSSHIRALLAQKEENLARISFLKTKREDLQRQISLIQNEIVELGGDGDAVPSLPEKTKKRSSKSPMLI
jgi:hypothetical protein